jgi:hypothetical protein
VTGFLLPSKWRTASLVLACAGLFLFFVAGIIQLLRTIKGNRGNPSPLQRAKNRFGLLYPEFRSFRASVMDIKGGEFIIRIDYEAGAVHPLWKIFSVSGDNAGELIVTPRSKYWICRK